MAWTRTKQIQTTNKFSSKIPTSSSFKDMIHRYETIKHHHKIMQINFKLINKAHQVTINSLSLFKPSNHCRTTSSKSLHNKLTPKKWTQLVRCLKVINQVWSQLKRILMAKLCSSICQIIKTDRDRSEKPSIFIQDQNSSNSIQHRFLFSITHRLSLHQPLRTLSNIHQQISIPLRRNHPFSNLCKHRALSQSFTSTNKW